MLPWMAAAVAAAVFAIPSLASSAPGIGQEVQCAGIVNMETEHRTGTCTAPFQLSNANWAPSDFLTHANFHTPDAEGSLRMEWWEDTTLHAVFDCDAKGTFHPVAGGVGVGPYDLNYRTACVTTFNNTAFYASGPQTLKVVATGVSCADRDRIGSDVTDDGRRCPFHGYLEINRNGTSLV